MWTKDWKRKEDDWKVKDMDDKSNSMSINAHIHTETQFTIRCVRVCMCARETKLLWNVKLIQIICCLIGGQGVSGTER